MKPLAPAVLLLGCVTGVTPCLAEPHRDITVEISFEDRENLIPHLQAQGYDARYGEECCQPEEDALGIWIGRKVPVEDVRSVIVQALQAYPQLVYYSHFGDRPDSYPAHLDYVLYIGGSKYAAMHNTVPVTSEEALHFFNRLTTPEELESFLISVQTHHQPVNATEAMNTRDEGKDVLTECR